MCSIILYFSQLKVIFKLLCAGLFCIFLIRRLILITYVQYYFVFFLAEVFFPYSENCILVNYSLWVIFKHLCAGLFCIFLGLLLLNFVITLHTPCNYHSVSSFHVLEPAQHPSIIQYMLLIFLLFRLGQKESGSTRCGFFLGVY